MRPLEKVVRHVAGIVHVHADEGQKWDFTVPKNAMNFDARFERRV